jgi:hypothetical protein
MSKTKLKIKIAAHQDGVCALTGVRLSDNQSANDTDRIIPKASNGSYVDENTRVVNPRAHMKRHGILRERPTALDELKSVFDDRVQTMKLKNKINNQLLAYQKRDVDHLNPDVVQFLEDTQKPIQKRLDAIDKRLEKMMKVYPDAFVQRVLKVPSVGEITAAAMLIYVDLEKASTPSALWKYTGLHCSAGERYTKGVAGGGNKTLRTVLWNTANSMMKNRLSGYRPIYDRVKLRLSLSQKMIKSRGRDGKLIEVKWRDTIPMHRHGAALRAIIKQFLADYWLVGREMAGLPITTPYVEGILGHTDITPPSMRGW